ncbi:hypothetical protein [Flocculibacter collagenilyticus]|uniref:hypothetical protein n=1 Tax=Flocculibacter collagenilyticus TaxID=2744479 RepID=UPI0018F4A348|nr:hypothetical protein [Flocculibacter collagenilyticus]
MFNSKKIKTLSLPSLLFVGTMGMLPNVALADGLSDLYSALEKLKGTDSISAQLEYKYTETERGKPDVITNGYVQLNLLDNENGLNITLSNEVLDRVDEESILRVEQEDAKTPTLNAINDLRAIKLRNMLSSASLLLRTIKKYEFVKEENVELNNAIVRKLSFTMPLDVVIKDKKVRSHVNDFEGSYEVFINENGIPIESHFNVRGDGSAFIFFNVDITEKQVAKYQVIKERLVIVQSENAQSLDSTWSDIETVSTQIITPSETLLTKTDTP